MYSPIPKNKCCQISLSSQPKLIHLITLFALLMNQYFPLAQRGILSAPML